MKIGPKNRSAELGFNVIEFLVGTVIIMIVAISLYAGIASAFTTMGSSRDRIRGTQIMMERVEGLRLYRWSQLTNVLLMPTKFTNYYYEFASGNESKGLAYHGNISVLPPGLNPTATYGPSMMKKVTVSVWWISSGISNYDSLTTYVSRDGIQNYVYANN